MESKLMGQIIAIGAGNIVVELKDLPKRRGVRYKVQWKKFIQFLEYSGPKETFKF